MNRYAFGDIHGGAQTLQALLERLCLQSDDRLYLLGDYIDRGPNSKGVLDIILELMESGFDLRPVRGNHEDMLLQTVNGFHDEYSWHWMNGWGTATLQSFGLKNPEEIPVRYLALLQQMPYLRVENDFVFVHAGLDMRTEYPLRDSSPLAMAWGTVDQVDISRLGGRRMVTGHIVSRLAAIELSLSSSHIFLDNGAFTSMQPEYGNLVALNLDSRKITLQPWID